MDEIGRELLRDAGARFEQWKGAAEKAAARLTDDELHWKPEPESNSVAVLLWHIGGNLRSRWRDFLTSDGEKPDRDRDSEFEVGPDRTRAEIMAVWDDGWRIQRESLARVTPADLLRTVTTRSKPETVIEAIHRQLGHLASHVGQIVYIAKAIRGPEWETLSIARGKSREFNEQLGHRV